MIKAVKKRIKSCIAGIALAASLISPISANAQTNILNESYKKWKDNVQYAKELGKKDSAAFTSLEQKVFLLSTSQDRLTSNTNVNVETWKIGDVASFSRYPIFSIQKVPQMASNLEIDYDGKQEVKAFVYSQTALLMKDNEYTALLTNDLPFKDLTCTAYSTTAAMVSAILMKNSTNKIHRLDLVAGIVYDPISSPEGGRHQWIEIDSEVVDPSIRNDSEKRYIPIVGVSLTYDKPAKGATNGIFQLQPRLYCVTDDMKEQVNAGKIEKALKE